jgi:Cu2+-containing amine oxidase
VLQVHQHFFCCRLDMAVDDPRGGQGLTVSEVNCDPMALGPDNPYGEQLSRSSLMLACSACILIVMACHGRYLL